MWKLMVYQPFCVCVLFILWARLGPFCPRKDCPRKDVCVLEAFVSVCVSIRLVFTFIKSADRRVGVGVGCA